MSFKTVALAAVILSLCITPAAFGQSSKATAAINTVVADYCGGSDTAPSTCAPGWTTVMSTTIKTSKIADLFVDASLVTGLYTETGVKGNGDKLESKAVAEATVAVRVVMDGNVYAQPDPAGNGVTFDSRVQTLTAKLGYIFTGCSLILDPVTGAPTGVDCGELTPEELKLVLETAAAHSFNFILTNVGVGDHTLAIQVKRTTNSTAETGGVAISKALYGLGSVTVESVRMVNKFEF